MSDQIGTVMTADTALGRIAQEAAARAASVTPEPAETRESDDDARARLEAQYAARLAWWHENLPRRYADHGLDALRPQQHPDDLRRWLEGDALNLVLSGDSRRGKTFAAYAVGNAAVRRGGAVAVAWTAADLIVALRDNARVTRTWDRLEAADLVLLDDLGREYDSTGWARSQVHRLLDYRHRERKRTIITTNLSYDDLVERYGDPIVERIIDDAVSLRLEGPRLS